MTIFQIHYNAAEERDDMRVCSALESCSPSKPLSDDSCLYCCYCSKPLTLCAMGCCADKTGRYFSVYGTSTAFCEHYSGLLRDPVMAGDDVHRTLWAARSVLESLLADDGAASELGDSRCIELYGMLEKYD